MFENLNKNRIDELIKLINHHDYQYYVLAEPQITDLEYDKLFRELQDLEHTNPELIRQDSPTQHVSGQILKQFNTVQHRYPMLSLSNTYTKEEIIDFYQRASKLLSTDNFEVVAELKIDGVAISLIYQNGKLIQGVTRGDGNSGDDITNNIRTIKELPKLINIKKFDQFDLKEFEVRGEAYMRNDDFLDINNEREEKGEKLYANPRNTTAGTLKLLDSNQVANRKIRIFTYYLLKSEPIFKTHYENLEFLKQLGFEVNPAYKICKNIDELFEFIDFWAIERNNLAFQTDGIVIKINSLQYQETLGTIARSPRWSIAYKYEAEKATTIIQDIKLQVGRTGAITPVAELQPTFLAGSTISRATLNNLDYLKELDARIGDTVVIEKGGDIIPKIVEVLKEQRKQDSAPFETPIYCPCHLKTKLYRNEDEANIYCINADCPMQLRKKIEHFVSRDAMDIEGLGEKVIDRFATLGLLNDISDLYRLKDKQEQLKTLDNFGQKSIDNLINAIEKSKNKPLERLIYALGIRYVGRGGAKNLSKKIKNLSELLNQKYEDIINIDEIGEITAQSIIQFINEPKNINIINHLIQFGVNPQAQIIQIIPNEHLNQKTFVFTGELQTLTRNQAAQMLEKFGAKESSSVSKKTSYVVVGANPGSKYQKAQELKIQILTEEQFLKLLES